MSRPRRTLAERADEGFRKEIRIKAAEYNIGSHAAQAERAGMSQSTYSRKLRNPEELTVANLRGIIQALGPDPAVILRLLGYDGA